MKKHKKDIIYFAIVALIAIAVMYAAAIGESKQEMVDCIQLQHLSETTPQWDPINKTGFYLTQSESEMCTAHDIIINAYVLK